MCTESAMKRVGKKMLAASRFAMGAESIASSGMYSKTYAKGSDPFEAIGAVLPYHD